MMKRVSCILLFVCFSFGVFGQVVVDGRSYEQVAESETLILRVNEESATFIVENRATGHQWTSFVPESVPAYEDANGLWQSNMQSLFTFSYTDLTDDLGTRQLTSLERQEHLVEMRALPDGVAFDIVLSDLEISLSVEVRIENSRLAVNIPHEGIVENMETVLVSILPLPFFGYASRTDTGYLVVPDGCGALYRFKPTGTRSMGDEKRISWYVYSPEEVGFDTYFYRSEAQLKNAYMPIFGSKFENDAFVAILAKGDTAAGIHFAESGAAVNLSRVSAEFTIRHAFELFLSEISVHGAYSRNTVAPIRYDVEPLREDRSILYHFLSGEDATYSGMARAYRAYLKERELVARTLPEKEIPMALSLFGGIVEDRLLFDKYVPMTTFAQAREIIENFQASGVERIVANVIGWPREGYYREPIIWPPERILGGRRGLKNLGSYAQNSNIDLYLSVYNVIAYVGNGRFKTRTDVVKEGNTLPVKGEFFDVFLLNSRFVYDRIDTLTDRLENYGIRGLSFEQIGEFLYHDYNEHAPSSRAETMQTWSDVLSLSREKLGNAAVYGAHIGLAAQSDFVFETTVESSGYIVLDESIPFYQMAIHGSVFYSADPANLFHDAQKQYLRWIEYGCVPYYELTYRKSELLAYTDYAQLFTSDYREWVDIATEQYAEFNREFGSFFHLEMLDHRYITENVVCVNYGGGNDVFINYGDDAVEVEGHEVPALGFIVVSGADL